jgi:hypothetical protein
MLQTSWVRRRRKAAVLLLVAIVPLESGCEERATRLSNVASCDRCPTGLTCGTDSANDFDFLSCPETLYDNFTKDCQVASLAGNGDLIAGFEVPPLDSIADRSQRYTRLLFFPDENTWYVQCALFGCVPNVHVSSDGRASIDNYDRCAVAEHLFQSSKAQAFDLGNLSFISPRSGCDPTNSYPGCLGYVAETLLVGCWAYDDTRVTAATPLERVWPEEIANFYSAFSVDCAEDGSEGRSCRRTDFDRLGTCHLGKCENRCLGPRDCERYLHEPAPPSPEETGGAGQGGEAVATAGGTAAGGGMGGSRGNVCHFACERAGTGRVKACRELAE